MNAKIVDLEELSDHSEKLRAAGKKLVATNGCFDLLHVGHVRYLQTARALGDLCGIKLTRGGVAQILWIGFDGFIAVLQAYIFMMLTIAYISMAHEHH